MCQQIDVQVLLLVRTFLCRILNILQVFPEEKSCFRCTSVPGKEERGGALVVTVRTFLCCSLLNPSIAGSTLLRLLRETTTLSEIYKKKLL